MAASLGLGYSDDITRRSRTQEADKWKFDERFGTKSETSDEAGAIQEAERRQADRAKERESKMYRSDMRSLLEQSRRGPRMIAPADDGSDGEVGNLLDRGDRDVETRRRRKSAEAGGFDATIGTGSKTNVEAPAIRDYERRKKELEVKLGGDVSFNATLKVDDNEIARLILNQIRPQLASAIDRVTRQVQADLAQSAQRSGSDVRTQATSRAVGAA